MKNQIKQTLIAFTFFVLLCVNPTSIFAGTNSPEKVAKDFAKAYFMLDQSMADYLSETALINDTETNLVEFFLEMKATEAKNRGYKLSFLRMKPTKMKTKVLSQDESSAKILFNTTAIRSINPFYRIIGSAFGLLNKYQVQTIIVVVKENGSWKIAPGAFDLPM